MPPRSASWAERPADGGTHFLADLAVFPDVIEEAVEDLGTLGPLDQMFAQEIDGCLPHLSAAITTA